MPVVDGVAVGAQRPGGLAVPAAQRGRRQQRHAGDEQVRGRLGGLQAPLEQVECLVGVHLQQRL
ncbi:MAG: hypothetical protein L0I24_13840, partial [Pseudonocardia sp.]|nr:hypothetical protein [Pseudonocardia sp.]